MQSENLAVTEGTVEISVDMDIVYLNQQNNNS